MRMPAVWIQMLANDPAAARQLAKQALTTDAGDWQSLYLFLHSSSQLLQQAGTPLSTAQKTNGMANGGLYASHKYVAKAQSPGDASEDRVSGLTQATGSLSQVNLTGEVSLMSSSRAACDKPASSRQP